MADGPLAGLLARAVVVIDKAGRVVYTELVPEIAEEPDYDAAVEARESLLLTDLNRYDHDTTEWFLNSARPDSNRAEVVNPWPGNWWRLRSRTKAAWRTTCSRARRVTDVLMICETWSDAKALAAHEQASHFTTLVPRLHQLGEMKLEKFIF